MQLSSKAILLDSGKEITEFTLENNHHMKVKVLSLGATLTDIIVPDAEGNYENVVLKWEDINRYEEHPAYFGAIVGRVAGRIHNGQVTLGDTVYQFPKNNNGNTLHGGIEGFQKKNWKGELVQKEDEVAVKLTCLSVDGEEGFPGNLQVSVIYTLNNDNQLSMKYEATTDKDTLVNLTNHAYFNLSGDAKRDVLEQEVYIDSQEIYELDSNLIPTGNLINVKEQPCFDFSTPKKIGQDIEVENKLLQYGPGYDHIWRLTQGEKAISLYDALSKRLMEITTTAPGVVMYTMNGADAPYNLANHKRQMPRFGVCFETQKAAVGYNEVNKEAIVLKPGEKYSQETTLSFSIK